MNQGFLFQARRASIILLLILPFILAMSCAVPTNPNTGRVRIMVGDEIGSKTLLPDLNMTPASYRIVGNGPSGGTFDRLISNTASTIVDNLAIGEWTLIVTARNAAGTAIGSGNATVTVHIGQTAVVPITVRPYEGFGDLNLVVEWPATEVATPGIVATLTPSGGVAGSIVFTTIDASARRASHTVSSLAAGYYRLSIRLQDNGVDVAGAADSVRIVAGTPTNGTFRFTPAASGGITVTVTSAMASPLTVSIAGATATKAANASLSLSASVAEGLSSTFAWYVDGLLVAENPSYTFGSTWSSGAHRIDVLALSADGTRAGSASTTITVQAAAASMIIDHTNWDPTLAYASLSPPLAALTNEEVTAAAALDVYLEHASVGQNIVAGIASLPATEARYTSGRTTWTNSYNASWWGANDGLGDNMRENPGAATKLSLFQSHMTADMAAALDVAMFKFCWIDSPLDVECPSMNADQLFAAVRTAMEGLETSYPKASYPDLNLVWWTMPLDTAGNAQRQAYNALVRNYCRTSGKWLLDIADLESHDPSGNAVVNGSLDVLYSGYASDEGHLNAAGQLKLAKAYWRLIGEIVKAR